jgi:hypothetical protein
MHEHEETYLINRGNEHKDDNTRRNDNIPDFIGADWSLNM